MSLTEPAAPAPAGLAALEERLRDDLVALGWPAKAWIPPSTRDGQPVHDVLVIGAGQAGLALSAALSQLGIAAVLLDKRSEEHTSELQSQSNLVCRLLLEKKKKKTITEISRQ